MPDLRTALSAAFAALRSRSVRRWLVVLQMTDLLGDVFLGYLAIYLVDVGGASPGVAGAGVAVLTASALVGDAALIRVLRRLDGLHVLRWSAIVAVVVYPAFLVSGPVIAKLALLVPIGILRSGWYAIPKGRLYAELPGRGGIAVAIGAPADLIGSAVPFAIGAVASRTGLGAAMWVLLAAPLALLLLLPRSPR